MNITTAPTCWACESAPATTVFPEHDLGPWRPYFACQPCLDAYLEAEQLEYH
ncbi:hypothetical protein AB0I35_00145 [Nocardia sp. NPDC050378]|uniref:hypothetical protein n=1 Tax=Nocardia sp. NPDC050378 TaxID=3155400 RepID=UPI0033DB1BA4